MKIILRPWSSSFFKCGVVFQTYTIHPNVLRWCTAGFFPCHASNACRPHSLSDTCSPHIPAGKALGLEHAHGGCHHHAILTLDDAVLLRIVGRCVLTTHVLNRAVLHELPHSELVSVVGAEHPELQFH
jgi:hypothetical protein